MKARKRFACRLRVSATVALDWIAVSGVPVETGGGISCSAISWIFFFALNGSIDLSAGETSWCAGRRTSTFPPPLSFVAAAAGIAIPSSAGSASSASDRTIDERCDRLRRVSRRALRVSTYEPLSRDPGESLGW